MLQDHNRLGHSSNTRDIANQRFNAGIKFLRATLTDENFYEGFCYLNRAFRSYMRETPTNTPIIHSVY
jgi:hypothetical protein